MRNFTHRLFVLALLFSAVFMNSATVTGAIATKHHVVSVGATSANTDINAQAPSSETVGDEDWTPEQRGKMDAGKYYSRWRQAKTWAFVTTAVFGGILGLIPAIVMSSTTPRRENLGYPNQLLMRDARYQIAYEKEARRIKGRKVWGGFGLGLIVAVVIYLTLVG